MQEAQEEFDEVQEELRKKDAETDSTASELETGQATKSGGNSSLLYTMLSRIFIQAFTMTFLAESLSLVIIYFFNDFEKGFLNAISLRSFGIWFQALGPANLMEVWPRAVLVGRGWENKISIRSITCCVLGMSTIRAKGKGKSVSNKKLTYWSEYVLHKTQS